MTTEFSELGVLEAIDRSLRARRITTPFPIQIAAIPPALAGKDVCGKAPTGSGKTIAFGIPIVSRCPAAEPRHPTGLVLVPTRELADQVADELTLLARPIGLIAAAFYGGMSIERQIVQLNDGVDIVVACPGRLLDLLDRDAVSLDAAAIVVIDEADRMADMGFLPDLRSLLDATPAERQTLLFSATLDGDVDVVVRDYLTDPEFVTVDHSDVDATNDSRHYFWSVPRNRRLDVTAQILGRLDSAIVFCRTRHGTERVTEQLQHRGVNAVSLHGDKSQGQREKALERFRSGTAHTLVATDVAGRGIHIDGVAGVIQFDTPADHKDYTHRSGRTARAGNKGIVITLVVPEAEPTIIHIQRALGLPVILDPIDLTVLDAPPH